MLGFKPNFMGVYMSVKAAVAVLLISLWMPALAQDETATPLSEQSLESNVSERPSLAPVMSAFMGSRQSEISTRVYVTYDASGNILEARLDPTTRDRNLDKAIKAWAHKVKITPQATGGTGWFPIDLSKSH